MLRKTNQCPRCGRFHSGVCGIPGIGVRIGIGGTGIPRRQAALHTIYTTHTKSASRKFAKSKPGVGTLRRLLKWGEVEKNKVLEMLKVITPEFEEYDQLLDRLGKLEDVLAQVHKQLASRGE